MTILSTLRDWLPAPPNAAQDQPTRPRECSVNGAMAQRALEARIAQVGRLTRRLQRASAALQEALIAVAIAEDRRHD